MSISSRITQIENHLEDDYKALENLGASVTDRNIENIKDMAEQIYDNYPKTSYQEGTSITLENCNKGKLDFDDGKVGFGQSSQDTTNGYQLLNLANSSNTSNGITSSITDGSILKISGKATQTWANIVVSVPFALPSGTYTFSINSSINANLAITTNNSESINILKNTTSRNATLSSATTSITISLSGMTVDDTFNATLKMQLESGSTAHTWEKYSGGYSSPSPNWEQQVKCVAGKNLAKEKNGNNVVISDILPTGTYTFSLDNALTNGGCNLKANNNSGTTLATIYLSSEGRKSATLTLSEPTAIYLNGYSNISGKTFVDNTDNFQLEEGIQATPYLPYNTIEEVVRGKNVFEPTLKVEQTDIAQTRCTVELDGDEYSLTATGQDMYFGEVTGAGTSYAQRKGEKIYVKGHSKLSFYLTNTLLYSNYITAYDENNVSLGYSNIASYKGVYNIPSGAEYITIRFGLANATSGTTYKTKVMITFSDTEDTTYEPYVTPKTYQLSLGDRKVFEGDYFWIDKTTGKKYHHHKIGETIFDGVNNLFESKSGTTANVCLTTNAISNIKPVSSHDEQADLICDYFLASTANRLFTNNIYGIALMTSNKLFVGFTLNGSISSAEQGNTWLTTHPMSVVYPLATETDEEITGTLAEQLEALYNAQSIKGTTIIESNGDLPLIIKVRALKGA